MRLKFNHGFTLIEILVVIVIIGILSSITIPNYIKIVNRARESSVKSNMHIVNMEVELFSLDHNGSYPSDVDSILPELPAGFRNPFNESEPGLQNSGQPDIEGVVEYETSSPYDKYLIYGFGKDARPLDLTMINGTN